MILTITRYGQAQMSAVPQAAQNNQRQTEILYRPVFAQSTDFQCTQQQRQKW